MANSSPLLGLKFCCDYMASFSPGLSTIFPLPPFFFVENPGWIEPFSPEWTFSVRAENRSPVSKFNRVSRAEISWSARVLKEILLKWKWRLHGEDLCPGWISARAENPCLVFQTGLAFSARDENCHLRLEDWKTSCNRSKFSARVETWVWAEALTEYSTKQNGGNGNQIGFFFVLLFVILQSMY